MQFVEITPIDGSFLVNIEALECIALDADYTMSPEGNGQWIIQTRYKSGGYYQLNFHNKQEATKAYKEVKDAIFGKEAA